MNKQVKKKWIKALKSGKYKQTKGHLKDETGHCCLGVLCDIYAKERKKGFDTCIYTKDHVIGSEGRRDETLPVKIVQWAELETRDPIIKDIVTTRLSILNDVGKTFEEIVKLIEEQY